MNNCSGKLGESIVCQPDREAGSDPPDAELLGAISDGEAEAFWHLWKRHQKNLRKLCLREMDGHTADAEDALSQVMLKVLDRLPTCAATLIRPEAWLHRLARNLYIDLRRERQRRLAAAESWKITTLAETKTEQTRMRLDAESGIQQHIAALPPSLRDTFVLRIVQEIPVKEVASQLGLSTANVRKRVQLARARLRRDLTGTQDGTAMRDRWEIKRRPRLCRSRRRGNPASRNIFHPPQPFARRVWNCPAEWSRCFMCFPQKFRLHRDER